MRQFIKPFKIICLILSLVNVLAISGCTAGRQEPPVARKIPVKLEKHGHVRIDDYYWLNQRDNSEVIDYLKAENEYTEATMAHTKSLQETLFQEFKERIKQTDVSVPYKKDGYFYYSRTEEGKEYPIYCRKKGILEAPEQVMLNVNKMAEGHDFLSVGQRAISQNEDILAYSVDTVGRRIYSIHFKDLVSGRQLLDKIEKVTGNMAWANDNRTLFYTRQDPTTLRWNRVYKHILGTDTSKDELVYEEIDETFSCSVFKTKSKRYIMIASYQTLSSEYRYLDANNPNGSFQVFLPRRRDHEYSVDHYEDHFYIRTNDGAKNFKLARTPIDRTGQEYWEDIICHRNDVFFEGMEIFQEYLVVLERKDGLKQIRIKAWSGEDEHYLDFGEPTYTVGPTDNHDFGTRLLRYRYTSLVTPSSVYDYDMSTRKKKLLKREEVLGGFSSDNYESERIYAEAKDGTKVATSLVFRKGTQKDGTNPLLLYGYGSYGFSMNPRFDAYRISLLDRGFIFAMAHIRGGQEMGRHWYEDGKLLKKKNTFTDFIACGEHLVEQKYTSREKLFVMGGSAGGLLIGSVLNMQPDLFKGAVAAVPFVDVVTTMLDDTIPLTTSEYDEWGNPNVKDYYDYMLSYSPYDNVERKDYPNILALTSLHDSQVQYWEPAKWVAKLRALKTDTNRLLLRTKMEAGHGGVSGRYKRYREMAFRFAFLLDLVGITE